MNAPTEQDLARWAKWEDLRTRQAEATTDEERAALTLEQEELEQESMKEVLLADMNREPQWLWLSFRDVETNTNLGVAIVEGGGVTEAALNARLRGCNPGGEVLAYPLSDPPNEKYRNRLLSTEELLEAGLIAEEE